LVGGAAVIAYEPALGQLFFVLKEVVLPALPGEFFIGAFLFLFFFANRNGGCTQI
jgi:hypothetical protein